MFSYGSFAPSNFLAPNPPITLFGVDKNFQYLRLSNNSPYQLSVDFGGYVVNLGEFRIKDLEVPSFFQGKLQITPTVNISTASHAQSNSLIVEGYYKDEVNSPVDAAIPQQSVSPTASGKPLFSANFGQGVTAGVVQAINVFNPPNSGVSFVFHSARVFSSSTTIPLAQLAVTSGADLNLPFAVSARSHDAQQNPPVSFAHVTGDDSGTPHGAINIEILDMPASLTQDLLAFPDQYTLEPGNNLTLSCNDSVSGKAVRLNLKWNEDIAVPAQGGVITSVATQIINEGNPLQPVVQATKSGDTPEDVLINNDGTATFKGILTLIGGMKINTIRDNVTGVDQIDLTTAGVTFNNIVTMLSALDINLTPVTINGQTSGHMDLHEYMQGTIKKVIIHLVNYKNTAIQTLALPVAFTDRAWIWVGETQGTALSFLASGVAQNIKVMTDGTAGAAGTQTTQATIAQWSHGQIDAAWDTFKIAAMAGAAANGVILIEGF